MSDTLPEWVQQPFINKSVELPPYSEEIIAEEKSLINKFGINYSDVIHALNFRRAFPHATNVLEVGGELSDVLIELMGIERWTSITSNEHDEAWHYDYQPRKPIDIGYRLFSVTNNDKGKVLSTGIGLESFYNLWSAMNSPQFDGIYSVAAFEHIFFLDEALDQMADMLCAGGGMYSNFSPIWSAHNGHHWGREPIPLAPYSHLAQSYSSVVDSLVKSGVDRKSARTHAFSIYHDMRINRLNYDNYMDIFDDANFSDRKTYPHRQKTIYIDGVHHNVAEGFTLIWVK